MLIDRVTDRAMAGSSIPLSVELLESSTTDQPLIVKIATLPTTSLPTCLHKLLELVFFAEEEPAFLSITNLANSTLTIVADVESIDALKSVVGEPLEIDETDHCVVRVGEGSCGFESIGVVERLTEPLANAGISVLYISTYSTDYVLLPRERRDEALDCLPWRSGAAQPSAPADEPRRAAAGHTHPLTMFNSSPSHVVRLEKRHRQRHTGALLRLLFMPQRSDNVQAIASLTETSDEISIIASADEKSWWAEYMRENAMDAGMTSDPQEWVPIRVGEQEGTPLSEIGVIATQARVLASANVSILYLSTFFSEFTLVQRADVSRAAEAFETAGLLLTTVTT